jgi:hypothetical protein
MIIIRFANQEMKRRALGYLTGRFSFKSWATGEMMVPEASLPFMAAEGIQYFVEGPASYERIVPALRNPSASVGLMTASPFLTSWSPRP